MKIRKTEKSMITEHKNNNKKKNLWQKDDHQIHHVYKDSKDSIVNVQCILSGLKNNDSILYTFHIEEYKIGQ